jgi:hypothetical protein
MTRPFSKVKRIGSCGSSRQDVDMFQLAELMVERQQVSQEFRNKLRKNRGYSSDESPFDSPSDSSSGLAASMVNFTVFARSSFT